MNFILIDGSYFIYYRYYCLKNWWKNAKRVTETNIPFDNERFIEKYRTTFTKKISELRSIYCPNEKSIVLVGKDCPSKNIWRRELFPEYKHGRKKDDNGVGHSFKMTYNENLFTVGGADAILFDPQLEADDCIAITSKHLIEKYPDSKIHIITSDMDYLQLSNDNTYIYNLQGKPLTESKNSFNDPQKDLFCKIISGDKSDNICGVFDRCGLKTAEKYYNDKELFDKKLNDNPSSREIYDRNRNIIDFNYIPKALVERFKTNCLYLK